MNTTQFGVKCGLVKAKGTAPAAGDLYGGSTVPTFGADTEILVTEPTIEIAPEMLDDESVNGSQFATGQDLAFLPVKVSGTHEVRTIGSGQILYHALGYDSLQGPISNSGKYAHLLLVDPQGKDQLKYTTAEKAQDVTITASDYKNRFFHFLRQEGPGNKIVRNATIKEFALTAEAKGSLKLEFSGTGQDFYLDKTFAQSSSMALPDSIQNMKRFKFSDLMVTGCYVGVWNAGGTAITEGKEALLNFKVSNNFGQAEGMTTSDSGLYQSEPLADGFNELTLEFSRYKVDTFDWLEKLVAGTEIAFRATFTVGSYVLKLMIPRLKISNVNPELGSGGKLSFTCKGLISDKANDPFDADRTIGATEMTLPWNTGMYMVVINDDATNYMRVN